MERTGKRKASRDLSMLSSRQRPRHRRLGKDDDKVPVLDFTQLDISALKKYKRFFKVRTKHNSNKSELASAVSKHWQTITIEESDILKNFVKKIRA
mmetsp:Transcript_25583/g.64234  ORF Transcript_25583/g.64234 Transcript_25583/m.64234 type:complete len:96 (-) Transcript_25583:86-373(-)|eukprot:CAMPEP_0177648702 /NCGR_PEP_ID=MMETSP0447-20121125/10968_1 /TAXON_ID=0 /ORGANISM="Stygamoeba regulata, Strain BSH-02190019" /LENGTH=95 /DNA_ID=CAMNT_0019151359 /DNA_START=91 /DNA_END=378 /DNA_ORIENTATION=-